MQTNQTNDKDLYKLEKEIDSIYDGYLKYIAPFVAQLEVLDGEFPIEILNEVRAIFTHFARCRMSDQINIKKDNVNKASRHKKRAILDCFKYLCVAYDDKYREFEDLYKNVDLSVIDNGDFLLELSRKRKIALDNIKLAKKQELESEDIDLSFPLFENASNSYAEVYNLIENTEEKLIKVKQKAIRKSRWQIFLNISGIVGTLFGIIGVIIAVIK